MNDPVFSIKAFSLYASRKALFTLHRWQCLNDDGRAQLLLSSAYKHPDVFSTETHPSFQIQPPPSAQVQHLLRICPAESQ